MTTVNSLFSNVVISVLKLNFKKLQMKRIIFMITLFVSLFSVASVSAQNQEKAIKQSTITDNMFIKANVGGSWSLLNRDAKFWENVNPMATISVGRYLTPSTSIQVSFEGGANEGGQCFVDHTNLTIDGLLNFSNLFGGYNGTPRVVEVVGVLGMGWFHTYGIVDNNASAKAAAEINFNLGKTKTWQINLIPSFTYLPSHAIENSYAALSLGVTYKFKNSNGTHNFVLVDIRDQKEIDWMNDKINTLRQDKEHLISINDKNATTIKDQQSLIEQLTQSCKQARETKVPVELDNVVQFKIGQSKVEELQMANLSQIADVLNENSDLKLEIKGYADAETGTEEINQILSVKRAESVKSVLVNVFGVSPDRITTVGLGSTKQLFKQNDWNRVAIFVKK